MLAVALALARAALEKVRHNKRNGVYAGRPHVKAKQKKKLVVAQRNAVVDPRAVVVHLDDAPVAHRAVVRARRLVRIALSAHLVRFWPLIVIIYGYRFRRHRTGICRHSLYVGDDRKSHDTCERNDVKKPLGTRPSHPRDNNFKHNSILRPREQKPRNYRAHDSASISMIAPHLCAHVRPAPLTPSPQKGILIK